MVRPGWVKPDELSAEIALLRYFPLLSWKPLPVVCA